MDNAEIRQIICEKCIVVRGFNNEIQFHQIQKSFPESRRINLATRTATLPSRDKEWIIQLQSVTDAQKYIEEVRIKKCPEGLLDISDCKLPCDIPDEWLQDEVISHKSTGSPKQHVSSGTIQPPPYSPEKEPDDSSLKTGEPVTISSIEVRGMKEHTTQDTIMYYFESKKGAKADVDNIEFVEDENIYVVTFENEEAVETVLSKSHIVDGAQLQVKRHVPLKRYPNKALVKGFSPNTTKDGIINFLEARTKFDVEEADFGDEDSGKAIVTFCEPIDIGDIQTACKKRALDGSYLTVHPVVVTNCIVIRGFSEETTESGLEYYFDNKRKSGVEGVTEVKMNRDEDYCVIYFENAEDALLACKRSHTIDNCTLNVNVFYDYLVVPADNERPKFKPLPPLVITDIDKYKVNFLKHSNTKRDAIEKQLQDIYAQITWPSSTQDSKITIDCALTKETKDCRKLAKSWDEEVRKSISSFVDALVTEKHSILQDAWAPVMDKLRAINISDPDGVTVSVEKPPVCEIIIAGYTVPVKEASDKIKQIIDEVSADLDRKKQSIQEDTKLKHHQLLILVYTHFKDKVKQKFEKLDVKIDTKNLVITFNGLSGNIRAAKIMMFETLNDITSASIGIKSPAYIQFLNSPEVKKYVGKKVKDKGLIGVWDIQGNTITMYSMSNADAVAASSVLKDCLVETQVHVDNLQKSVIRSPKWAQYVQGIHDEYERKSIITEIIEDKQGEIILYCTSKGEAGMIREKIKNYFLDNSEKEITINLPPAQLKFLQEEMKDEVDDLEKGLRKQNIIVAVKGDGILIKGNPQGINDAEQEIEALVQKIYRTKHSMDKPGLQELMNTGHGKSKLKQVSKQAGVIISSDSDEDERSSDQIRPRQGASSDERAVYSAAGGQEVIVVKGDITGLDVDVIVNAANKDLAHSGGLAKVLVNKGGKSIQDECDQFTSFNGQLTEGECYCSKPGMLSCQMIVHAVGPMWQGGSKNEEDSLQQCVETALVQTEKNKHTSIAIPALCTGIFGYPPHLATRAIAQAVRDYFKRSKFSIVETVYLCDVNENSVGLFVKAGDKMFDQAIDRKPKFGGRQSGGMSSRHSDPISTGSIEIKIVKGELAKMRVDAIVNTTSKGLQLNQGAVSASLLSGGGKGLQYECSKKYPQGVDYGEVAVTTGGNLNCNIVCHGCLDQWSPGGIKVLEKFINGCLSKADGKGCKSIAMPAMGTGKLGYPRALVAKHMYDTVQQYSSGNPNSCITKVLFVLHDKDVLTVKAFEAEEGNRQGSHHGRHDREFTDKPTGYQGRVPIYERLKDETDVTILPTLLARGHYRSYHNRVYLGGPCNVGKSSLASILIGENAPLEWHSTDSLVIYFGRNGIDLETKTMVPIRKDSFGHDVLSRVLRGEPNLDTPEIPSEKETVESISNIQTPCTEAANQNENNSFIEQEKGHPSDASIIPCDSNVSIHEVEDNPKHKQQMKTGILDDSSISALAQTPFSISNDLKTELKRGQYEMKIAPSDLVDFGGQKSFDMTHQLFIQQRGEFLLLFDCRKSLTDRLEEYKNRDITTADIFRHWVDSILIYCPDDNEVTPTILFVATHSDSFSQDEVVRRKAIAVESLSEMFQNHHMNSRIIYDDVFFIDATEKTDPEIERLKAKIVDIATRQSSWGKPMPISWVPLEMQLDKMKSLNISIIEKTEIMKLNSSNDDLALDERELEYFLKMQHSLGKMLYFGQHGLEKFIVVQPTSLVEILRAFITDEIFWPKNGQLSSILQNLNNTGKLLKKDLLKLWAQPVFSRIMPTDECKEFMIAVLLHLDILIEPKGYKGPRTLLAEYFLVPCIVQKKTAKGVLSYPNINERAICLSYQMKSSVPSAISYKLLGAAVHVWPLKIVNDNLCLYNKAANFCIDKNNELYISVEEKRVVAILINCQSRKDIPSGIAASIQECLTLALTKVIQFYQNNFGSFHMNPDGSGLFEMNVGVICGKQICFIPVVEVSEKKSWICRRDTKHNTDDLQVWEFKDYQGCPPSCTGPSENDLNMCPTDKHLIRLAAVLGINCFDTYYVHLEMDRKDWEEIEYQYRGNDPVSMKFMALIEWRRRRKNDVKVQNLLDALKAVEERQHILCKICRDIDNVNDDTIATEGESVQYPRLQQVPGDSVLEELSQQIGNCVIQLGIELGLDSNTIDETMYRMYKDLFGQTFDILKKWKERNGKEATYDALLSALEHVGGRGIPFVKCQVGVEVKK